ncbi:hypothetical protein SOVF_030360 [Spinacia oleracea]|nr:hypothetical protein SOVF_030360 [Spinacia oleracea]
MLGVQLFSKLSLMYSCYLLRFFPVQCSLFLPVLESLFSFTPIQVFNCVVSLHVIC